ncbi:MAG: glycosyltransferase family 1 protein [Leptolyngbyaceae cyanobacterium RU_5_1]|nr:glycosyltransferase family 1 protein [Leptolyngbyaceae cyanobacterium RU_5_1]
MNVFVLSELHPNNTHIGWSVNYSLEDTLATACNAQFLYPICNDIRIEPGNYATRNPFRVIERYRNRIFKSWYKLDRLPTLGNGPNILLIVGNGPGFLMSMFALGSLLKQFDLRVGYVLDGFNPSGFRSPAPYLDHLFVISAELADEIRELHPFDVSFLPLGVNTLPLGPHQTHRHIDIIGYGRTHPGLHAQLQPYFNHQSSDRIYFHSTFSHGDVESPREHITLLNKLLNRSKISLCFEVSDVHRFRGQSPLVYRWLEGWAAGCGLVGKKPFGKGVAELMDWQDSTIDMPEQPADWIPFLEALLDDETRLAEISLRNYRECRLRHDWRYRLQGMFEQLSLPIPRSLAEEITQFRSQLHRPENNPKNPCKPEDKRKEVMGSG